MSMTGTGTAGRAATAALCGEAVAKEGVYYAKLVPRGRAAGSCGRSACLARAGVAQSCDQLGSSFVRGDATVDPKYPGQDVRAISISLCRIAEVR